MSFAQVSQGLLSRTADTLIFLLGKDILLAFRNFGRGGKATVELAEAVIM